MTPEDWNTIRKGYEEITPVLMANKGRGVSPYSVMDWFTKFTPIEDDAWQCIRGRGVPLYPQYPVLKYFLDFGNPYFKIGLELDGAQWHDYRKDKARDEALHREGWKIFRVPGSEAVKQVPLPEEFEQLDHDSPEYEKASSAWLNSIDGVVASIDRVLMRRRPRSEEDDMYRRYVRNLYLHAIVDYNL